MEQLDFTRQPKIFADILSKRSIAVIIALSAFLTLISGVLENSFAPQRDFIPVEAIQNCHPSIYLSNGFCQHYKANSDLSWRFVHEGSSIVNGKFFIKVDLFRTIKKSFSESISIPYLARFTSQSDRSKSSSVFQQQSESKMTFLCEADSHECVGQKLVSFLQPKKSFLQFDVNFILNPERISEFDHFSFSVLLSSQQKIVFYSFLRIFFGLMSLFYLIWFTVFVFDLPGHSRTFEHKFLVVLSISLFLFNNPFHFLFYTFSFVYFEIVPNIFEVFFTCLLIFFWIIMFERIKSETYPLYSRKLTRVELTFFGISTFLICSLSTVKLILNIEMPTRNFLNDCSWGLALVQVISYLIAISLGVFLLLESLAIRRNWNRMISRFRFFYLFSFFFIVAFIIYLPKRLIDSFTGSSLDTESYVIVQANIYVLILLSLWTTIKHSKEIRKEEEEKEQENDLDAMYSSVKMIEVLMDRKSSISRSSSGLESLGFKESEGSNYSMTNQKDIRNSNSIINLEKSNYSITEENVQKTEYLDDHSPDEQFVSLVNKIEKDFD